MTKWGPVFFGFILAVIVKSFFAHYEFIGLLLVGFIVGYLCRDGAIRECGMQQLPRHSEP